MDRAAAETVLDHGYRSIIGGSVGKLVPELPEVKNARTSAARTLKGVIESGDLAVRVMRGMI